MRAGPPPHLVIPFAACSGQAWLQTMQALPAGSLKNLGRLLRGMKLQGIHPGQALSLSTPHERVLAQACGLAAADVIDGLIPWAALEAAGTQGAHSAKGNAWAFITPCHWRMGREYASLTDPAALELTPQESHTLLAAMQPYFDTEGITLHYAAPQRWLAEGELLRHLPTASLDRVVGRNVDTWLPGAIGAGLAPPSPASSGGSVSHEVKNVEASTLRRLQNEMQMLLYTHPVNEERSARRQLCVNSFWLSGTGALGAHAPGPAQDIIAPRSLAQAAFSGDWDAYAHAWGQLDAGEAAQLLARQNSGEPVRLSLCGERDAQTFETASPGLFSRISSLLTPQRPLDVLKQL